jgi:hypothetical protein
VTICRYLRPSREQVISVFLSCCLSALALGQSGMTASLTIDVSRIENRISSTLYAAFTVQRAAMKTRYPRSILFKSTSHETTASGGAFVRAGFPSGRGWPTVDISGSKPQTTMEASRLPSSTTKQMESGMRAPCLGM